MRIDILSGAVVTLLGGTLAHAQTAPPPAPQVSASAGLKELVFEWEPVPGAYTYWLLEKPYDPYRRTYFTPIQNRMPRTRTRAELPVAVHLFRWWENRYKVAACNSAGCSSSAEIDPLPLMLDAIGYLKASNAEAGDRFGSEVALSADGATLAVSAPGEDGAGSASGNDPANNDALDSGAVYVFRRDGRRWAQEAYLKGTASHPGRQLGSAIELTTRTMGISGDGEWLAVGAPAQSNAASNAGAVHVFRRASGGWSQVATLEAPTPAAEDRFGFSVDMSRDGRTLKVSALGPRNSAGNPVGRTYIYVRPDLAWTLGATLAPYHAGDECPTVRMSGNGRTLVAACRAGIQFRAITLRAFGGGTQWERVAEFPLRGFKVGQSITLDHHATRLFVWEGAYVYDRQYDVVGSYQWTSEQWVLQLSYLGPRNTAWPSAVAFDTAAHNTAISQSDAAFAGAGVQRQFISGSSDGGVFPSTFHLVKAPNPEFGDAFGASMSFSGNGFHLAVGAPQEDGASRGIDGDRSSNGAEDAGAVYLY